MRSLELSTTCLPVQKAIARHLRKTILRAHRHCIRQFNLNSVSPPKCPYAYAYVNWRMGLFGISWVNGVDNGRINKRLHSYGSVKHVNKIKQLVHMIEERQKKPLHTNQANWVISHTLAYLIMNDFKAWLIASKPLSETGVIFPSDSMERLYIPFFALQRDDESMSYEFHKWTEETFEQAYRDRIRNASDLS